MTAPADNTNPLKSATDTGALLGDLMQLADATVASLSDAHVDASIAAALEQAGYRIVGPADPTVTAAAAVDIDADVTALVDTAVERAGEILAAAHAQAQQLVNAAAFGAAVARASLAEGELAAGEPSYAAVLTAVRQELPRVYVAARASHHDEGLSGAAAEGEGDQWLLFRAQHEDSDAFGELYDRHFDRIYRYIYFRVNDRKLAEDITCETFLRALKRLDRVAVDQNHDVGSWLLKLARNLVQEHLKPKNDRSDTETEGEAAAGDPAAPSGTDIDFSSLTSQELLAAMEQLPDDERDVLTLRYLQGLSKEETAEVMGLTTGRITALQHRGIRRLADIVAAAREAE